MLDSNEGDSNDDKQIQNRHCEEHETRSYDKKSLWLGKVALLKDCQERVFEAADTKVSQVGRVGEPTVIKLKDAQNGKGTEGYLERSIGSKHGKILN